MRPDGAGTPQGTWQRPETERCETAENKHNGTGAGRTDQHRRERAQGARQELGFQRVPKGRKWPTSQNLPSVAFPDFQRDTGVKFLIDNLGRDKVTFARNECAETAQNCERVSMRSPTGTPHDRGAGKVLTEATVREFALVFSLRAVGAGLLGVRGAGRDVKGCVGVAQNGGKNIRRP